YGDSIFIIDLWIWIALGVSVWLSLRRERGGATNWQRPAWIGFTAVCAYIFVNGLITGAAERMASSALDAGGRKDALVVASPPPQDRVRTRRCAGLVDGGHGLRAEESGGASGGGSAGGLERGRGGGAAAVA